MATLFETPVPQSVRLFSLALAFVAAAGIAASVFLATDYRSTLTEWRAERAVQAGQIAELRRSNRQLAGARADLETARAQVTQVKARHHQILRRTEVAHADGIAAREELAALAEQIAAGTGDLGTLQGRRVAAELALVGELARQGSARRAADAAEVELAAARDATKAAVAATAAARTRLAEFARQSAAEEDKLASLQGRVAETEATLATDRARRDDARQAAAAMAASIAARDGELKALDGRLAAVRASLGADLAARDGARRPHASLADHIAARQGELTAF